MLPIELPIVLPIELPIEFLLMRQQPGPGPGRLGWLAWFKMLLGLGGWGGGHILSFFLKQHINVQMFA